MTVLGYIMLPLGLAGLLISRKVLYRLFVFWTLFSASSVANVGQGENASALQVWMFFGALWLARILLESLAGFPFAIDKRILRPCAWIVGFMLVAALSLVMPLYINGSLSITSPILFDGSETPLYLTPHHLTQLLYLVFGGTIAIVVAQSNLRDEERQDTERTILISAIVLSLWGFLQFTCNVTGAPYPDYIFNNSESVSGKGFLETLNGIGRVSSATVEPSMFAECLITLLPLTIPAWLGRGSIFSIKIDRLCAVFFACMLVLSTSSTGYVGIVVLMLLQTVLLVRTGTVRAGKALMRSIVGAVLLGVLAVLSFLRIPVVRNIITRALLEKAATTSGMERAMTVRLAFGYFQKYPVLGIGWGSATSHDLIVKLLSNLGIAGTSVFLAAMYWILRENWRSLGALDSALSLSRFSWMMALLIFLITSAITGFPVAFGNFWLVIGMAMSTAWTVDPLLVREK